MNSTGTKVAPEIAKAPRAVNGNGKVADMFPQQLAARDSLMAKIDDKGRETVELSKGTIWLIATAATIIGLLIAIAPQLFSWIREDQSKAEQLKILQKDVESLRKQSDMIQEQLEKIRESQKAQEIQNAKVAGYELGAADKINKKKEQQP